MLKKNVCLAQLLISARVQLFKGNKMSIEVESPIFVLFV